MIEYVNVSLKGIVMSLNQDGMEALSDQLRKALDNICNNEQIKIMSNTWDKLSLALRKTTENISIHILTEEMQEYIAEAKESEKLSQSEFEAKYSYEMDVCKQLGNAGWCVSEYSNPRKIREWYKLLLSRKSKEIAAYFEEDKSYVTTKIIQRLTEKYDEEPSKRYFIKAKQFFEQEDYMTTAIYLVALIEARTNKLMNFPKGIRYSKKYSLDGFESHLQNEFGKIDTFLTKRFLFLEMYPSIIEFLRRLFVDGEYNFENGKEPPYINRNWLLHGRSNRKIERYECIQLFNALSVIEFVFSIGKNR